MINKTLPIGLIRVGKRHRKEMGDIELGFGFRLSFSLLKQLVSYVTRGRRENSRHTACPK